MKPLRFAVFGAGFWARYQSAAWREIPGAQCIAICDREIEKARALAKENRLPESNAYDDPEKLLTDCLPDFVDIVTDVNSHVPLSMLCCRRGVSVICQKPMAPSVPEAEELVRMFAEAGLPFLVHENWRWQAPIRRLKQLLDQQVIGKVFRACIDMISGFPVFQTQPFLRELEQFILADLGIHILDTARFLFGEVEALTCITGQVHPDIRGEDHATILLRMASGHMPVIARLSYAENYLERECFPQTLFFIEGSRGSIEVAPNFIIKVTTEVGTESFAAPPVSYPWTDPRFEVVQSSMVACNENLLDALRVEGRAETYGADNLKSLRLVYSAYESARTGSCVICS